MIENVTRTPEGGARLLLNGLPTEFSSSDVDALLRALVEPPPEPKPLDVRVGDWVRRHDDTLCRVVKVGDGLATLRACDDPEDEEVCGAWAFRVVERLPEGWEWEPEDGGYVYHVKTALDDVVTFYDPDESRWMWAWLGCKNRPLTFVRHDDPESTTRHLAHVLDVAAVEDV